MILFNKKLIFIPVGELQQIIPEMFVINLYQKVS
jgi:hypothetical protein